MIGVALFQLGLVALLLVNENDGAEDEDFGADAEERPKGGVFVLNPDHRFVLVRLLGDFGVGYALVDAPVGQLNVFDE